MWFAMLCGHGWGMVNVLGPFVTEGDAIKAGTTTHQYHRVIVFEGREVVPEVASNERRIRLQEKL